jgi:hypothetical protein
MNIIRVIYLGYVVKLVGYDKDKKDMVDGIIVDKFITCPELCYDANSPMKNV